MSALHRDGFADPDDRFGPLDPDNAAGYDDESRPRRRLGLMNSAALGEVEMSPAEISTATGMKGENVRFLLADGEVIKAERAATSIQT